MSCAIRSWKVSYYHHHQRAWLPGQLTCCPLAVQFQADSWTVGSQGAQDHPQGSQPQADTVTENESQSAQVSPGDHHGHHPKGDTVTGSESEDLLLQYTDIRKVQRAKSMWIFPAVTVETQDGIVHWFSSLPDRHSVFNALDYFSRHNLLEISEVKKLTCDPATHTALGQQLLRSAEDSERTLAAAATDLHAQGRQLDRASVQLMETHDDLDSADRLLSGLNTYLGQWTLPPQYKQLEMVPVSRDDIPSDQELEVLSSELCKDHWCPQQLTFLRVTESGMVLLSSRQRPLHSLRWMDLSRVFVVSPWEVVFTRHVAGRADVSVSVVSAALLPVLRLLERKVPHLMDYQTPSPSDPAPSLSDSAQGRHTDSPQTKMTSGPAQLTPAGKPRGGAEGSFPEQSQSLHQVQAGSQRQEQMSEEEMSVLCTKLGGLKTLAVAVGGELTTQNQALDAMIQSVQHADSRVCEATRRTKKLM